MKPARPAVSRRAAPLSGRITAPGDKSVSHRAIILGGLAHGRTTVTGLLEGADILATADAMRALGATVTRTDPGAWTVDGVGAAGLRSPEGEIDCGNAGTGVRLIMGAAAGYALSATFTGDASLRSRPMNRVLDPLRLMGAKADAAQGGRLPCTIRSDGAPAPIDYSPPKASAQVKSCVLLAGLRAAGRTTVREIRPTRDHTEDMLAAFGVPVRREGSAVSLDGPADLRATHVEVPGDPSSAAFAVVAGLIVPGSDLVVAGVMLNPRRTALFDALAAMGADLSFENDRTVGGGARVADIHVRHSRLAGIVVDPDRAADMIDEYPVLAVAASVATGPTVMDGIHELRVKESDRIAATVALLRGNGVRVDEREDGLTVHGLGPRLSRDAGTVPGGGTVATRHDHRIAMSALVLGLVAQAPVAVDDAAMVDTSYPDFFDHMRTLGAEIG
ncbi:3-phosphoshikimate 1-carboxyvinyltransferase [uncultured Algimonas sp.]|uniref:3-phosphoshikimate 1-carboxyvinyltransferase n=1 Tax=uncultured Algimonas sp. TaxID=1547920 RepID=UPI0026066856|nr:3-phosphoshikimate 1-carboxyvinyltransferase [uncultured Algimonas sp.]